MNFVEILILGFIQGVAEFLPISSSAHLIIFRDVFGVGAGMSSNMELTFDIALHFGTLLAIGVFFFWDFIKMIQKGFTKGVKDDDGKILWYLVAATIPAAIAGVLFEDAIENVVRSNYVVITSALAIMGVIIYLADKYSKQTKNIKKMTLKDAIIVGCSQVFALIPGFSRSGTTIAAGRILGLDRESAAKFSFYLSAPVVLGAVVLQFIKGDAFSVIVANLGTFVLGILVSFVIGLLCIKYLLKYLQKHNFKIFMVYRVALAVVVLVYIIVR